LQTHGRPAWTPRDYAALAREGYGRNAIVYRCVRTIAEAAASVPWLLYDGAAEVDRHPLLALLARPNRRQAGGDFREALIGHLLVAGNAYVEAVAVDGAIRELHVLRPDRMKVVPGADGWPEAYEYSVGGRTVRFPSGGDGISPILHLAQFHPLDDHYGFAPIEAAAVALDIHNAAGAWNKALLDNSARPSGALVYQAKDGGNLSQEQDERLKDELESGFTGAARAGRPLLLEGGLDWKTMALTPRDMDFMAAKNGAAREIALAFGVPPMLLGIPGDNTYSNYKEANLAFWRGTVLPLAGRLAAAAGSLARAGIR
jgi:HK97 family phage portal protein